jgi:hypothetical protein
MSQLKSQTTSQHHENKRPIPVEFKTGRSITDKFKPATLPARTRRVPGIAGI